MLGVVVLTAAAGGGGAAALSGWQVASRRRRSAPHQPPIRDFVSLNRDAVGSGVATSKELSRYRAQRGGAEQGPDPKPGGGASLRPAVPDITFGVTNRPPSPLADILSHQYARRWLDEQLSRGPISSHRKPRRIPDTRTSLLRKSTALPHIPTPFKLSRFTQVAAVLDTFRDPDARRRALGARQRGRTGTGENSAGQ